MVLSCPCTIWDSTATPQRTEETDISAVEVGVKFRSELDGFITGIRFYKGITNTSAHIGNLWTRTGSQLASVTFTNETVSGWQQADFASPAPITANTTYVASYHTSVGRYAVTEPYFAAAGVDNPPLHALADGVDGGNGVYKYGASGFPTQTWNASNYWVDVVFTTDSPAKTTPTVTSVSPANGATGVDIPTVLTATFSEPMDAGTINTSTFELRDPANNLVGATVTYDAATRTATLDPADLLAYSTTYTAVVKGGTTDPRVKDTDGIALVSNYTWSFTTTASGLVAAYAFDEGTGTGVADASGHDNAGIISGAQWTGAGKLGAALSFDGVNDSITVNDAPSLDLTHGMTLEAWSKPNTISGWRTVILKEDASDLAYALYANNDGTQPGSWIRVGTASYFTLGPSQLPVGTWTHVAATYDSSLLKLYVNGALAGSSSVSGPINVTSSPMRIGGNSIWGEWFDGLIDEIRIYSRPLTQAEIQRDINTPVGKPDFQFTVSPSTRSMPPNGSTSYEADVTFLSGFTSSDVDLWVTGLPSGVTGSYTPDPLPHQGRSVLSLTASGAALGSYSFTMGATAEAITHFQTVALVVSANQDFNIIVDPATQNVARGGSTTYQVTLDSINGFADPVTLSVSGLPTDATGSFNPASASPPATSTLTITASTSSPSGQYTLIVSGASGDLNHSTQANLVVASESGVWTVSPMGSTGVGNNSVRVGPARNDGVSRVYVGTIETGRVLEYSWNGSSWSGPLDVGGSPSGQEIHNFNMGPGRNDGLIRIYACSLDRNLYELSFSGFEWTQNVVGTLDDACMHSAVGMGRNDGINRVYAVSIQSLYEYTWNGISWSAARIGPIPGAHGISIASARGDSLNSLYVASVASGTYEARWTADSWSISPMGDSGDVRDVSAGVGRNDGLTRVYSALLAGQVREFTWNGSGWSFTEIAPSLGSPLIHAYVVPGRNDGTNRVYASAANGNSYEFSWNGSTWTTYNMGGGSGYMYGFHFGAARNDGIVRLYGADRGSANQVYEYAWSVAPAGSAASVNTLSDGPLDPSSAPTRADAVGNPSREQLPALTSALMQPVLREAISRRRLVGTDAALLETPLVPSVGVADSPGGLLRRASGNRMLNPPEAGGHGWFIDATRRESQAIAQAVAKRAWRVREPSPGSRKVDLVTVIGDVGWDVLVDAVASHGRVGPLQRTNRDLSLAEYEAIDKVFGEILLWDEEGAP